MIILFWGECQFGYSLQYISVYMSLLLFLYVLILFYLFALKALFFIAESLMLRPKLDFKVCSMMCLSLFPAYCGAILEKFHELQENFAYC